MHVLILLLLVAGAASAQEPKPLPPGWTIDKPAGASCKKGHHLDDGECVRDIPRVVDRGFFGCTHGYVQHPADPEKCVLPVIAEKILHRARH